jgi:response regulator RpfG family c-di-GMP phosphodiesterase
MSQSSILLVDDEAHVLSSISRMLGEENFEAVISAQSGDQALKLLEETPDLAVLVSDYRMPGMNGIELLAQARSKHPDVTRILLTGAADLEMALDAVNQGNIFRFLLKPCAPEVLLTAIKDGLRQNELIKAERELLNKTLSGSIKVMIDILAMLSPNIFAQMSRLRTLARDMATALNLEDRAWEFELAAMLSQIGTVTIPQNILERWQRGESLSEDEGKMVRSIPAMGKLLISNIPRLEAVAEAVGAQNTSYEMSALIDAANPSEIPLGARILRIIIHYDRLIEKNHSPSAALQTMLSHASDYDPDLFSVFRLEVAGKTSPDAYKVSHLGETAWSQRAKEKRRGAKTPAAPAENHVFRTHDAMRGERGISIVGLKPGMVLARDVLDHNGVLIVPRRTTITDVLIYKMTNYFRMQAIAENVFIESDF